MHDTEHPKVELKELPRILIYEFLDTKLNCHVIVNAKLGKKETDKLLVVLKRYRGALGYTIHDLKEIIPSVCMHQIMLE